MGHGCMKGGGSERCGHDALLGVDTVSMVAQHTEEREGEGLSAGFGCSRGSSRRSVEQGGGSGREGGTVHPHVFDRRLKKKEGVPGRARRG